MASDSTSAHARPHDTTNSMHVDFHKSSWPMLENRGEYSGNGTRQITGRGRAEDPAVNSAEGFVSM